MLSNKIWEHFGNFHKDSAKAVLILHIFQKTVDSYYIL